MARKHFNLLNLVRRLNRKLKPSSIDRNYVNLYKSELLDIIHWTTEVARESPNSYHGYKNDSNITINIENFYGVLGNIEGKNSNVNYSNPICFNSETSDNTQYKGKEVSGTYQDAIKLLRNIILNSILKHPIVINLYSGAINWWKELLLIIST